MIPSLNIVAWSQTTPWAEQRQVEQDLIISRAMVALFSDGFLKAELRFRGGTALNKLHFPKPLRYSEDLDLTRTTEGPVGPVLDALRKLLIGVQHRMHPLVHGALRQAAHPQQPLFQFVQISFEVAFHHSIPSTQNMARLSFSEAHPNRPVI